MTDPWSRWLLDRRDAGDERERKVTLAQLAPIRDRVLDGAGPLPGATVLDVGAGVGLVGLGALERVGADGQVIFADVSSALLEASRAAVVAAGHAGRARFVECAAEDLAPIADGSIDVVTTRSVLTYVADQSSAFRSMRRVLRPGGRISLFEPINRLMADEPRDRFWGYEVEAVAELADRVKATFERMQDPAAATMRAFDDRDLARHAEAAGFDHIHLECHIDVKPGSLMPTTSLVALLDSAPNPLAPTIRETISASLTNAEQAHFLAHLGQAVAEKRAVRRSAVAYLSARAGCDSSRNR